jgi:hypothetical protein
MIINTQSRAADQARRLRLKSLETQLAQRAVRGAGLSPWEANVLVDVVNQVYFTEPEDRPLLDGQMRYTCADAAEGAGKSMEACRVVTVVLSMLHKDDQEVLDRSGASELRRFRIQRLTEEAREQKGLLSQEDLSRILACDVRTIRRDIQCLLQEREIIVATRGQQKDIGPTVSHKGIAIRHWLDGAEIVDVAKKIHHTIHAVERYIQHFSRVVFLARKKFELLQIALTVGISSASVRTYLEIYQKTHWQSRFAQRFEEIDLIGAQHYEAEDAKKGVHSQPPRRSGDGRRP